MVISRPFAITLFAALLLIDPALAVMIDDFSDAQGLLVGPSLDQQTGSMLGGERDRRAFDRTSIDTTGGDTRWTGQSTPPMGGGFIYDGVDGSGAAALALGNADITDDGQSDRFWLQVKDVSGEVKITIAAYETFSKVSLNSVFVTSNGWISILFDDLLQGSAPANITSVNQINLELVSADANADISLDNFCTGNASGCVVKVVDPDPEPPEPSDPPGGGIENRPHQIGIFLDGEWMLDNDGDGVFTPSTDSQFSFGAKGAVPIVGDWNGDGDDEIGIFLPLLGNSYWFLDYDGNGSWNSESDKLLQFAGGLHDAQPVVGDWNGDGTTNIGIYFHGYWLLDLNGDGVYSGSKKDAALQLGGWMNSRPLVGDWNGDGKDSPGIYANGKWFLDYDADHTFDVDDGDKIYTFGWNGSTVTPRVGDWNGDGRTKVGAYQNGQGFLDIDGDGGFRGTGERPFFLGPNPSAPIAGDWNGDGADTLGVVDNGVWYLDQNGDQIHSGSDPLHFWGDDWSSGPVDRRVYIRGRWGSSNSK